MDWELTGRGWSTCSIRVDDQVIKISASYLSDALKSLIKSACDLTVGSSSAFAHLSQEPGCTRIFLSGAGLGGADRVYLQIVRFGGSSGDDMTWSEGRVVFAGVVSLSAFVGSVRRTARAVLDTWGESGYLEQWGMPFPMERLNALNQVLESRPM
ncbi:hypothetical protein ACFXK0_14165 [Nocardia sp. NPDC059177]|uniref:hypothetical protein n=1 Tax=Nocardia sp. NPDC059177 TaxID=3346759 RepID=UPI00367DEB61